MTTLHLRKSIGRSPWSQDCLVILLALVWFAFSQTAQALLPAPTPDGSYSNWNTAEGSGALFSLTTGTFNTAIGGHALYGNTFQSANTAVGAFALAATNPGSQNVAVGQGALRNNTGSYGNVAIGFQALLKNTTGNGDTAVGYQALFSNTTGQFNTANGYQALFSNTTGFSNVATGISALSNNTTGFDNTATGQNALTLDTTGSNNTANGFDALQDNMIGNNNTACGVEALFLNVANNNTANGFQALAINTTGNNNTAVGGGAGQNLTTGNNNIDIGIGAAGVAGESKTIRIGGGNNQTKAFIAGIRGITTGNNNALPVLIDSAGQLGTVSSSRRFKHDIKPMDNASEAVLALKPVTFHYRSDNTNRPEFGLIAEQVAEVNPELVVRDEKGQIYTVRYDAVNAMLLNEFLKEHWRVEELEKARADEQREITQLKQDFRAALAELTASVKEQDSKIEKVSAQLELTKPEAEMVANHE